MKSVPEKVLKAFNSPEIPELLDGGQGGAFRAGNVVLKPSVLGNDWSSEILDKIQEKGFRVSRPVRASNGQWVFEGWGASQYIPGRHDTRRVGEIIAAGKAFHWELKDIPRPGFLDERTDPWAVADRMAWGEIPLRCPPPLMKLLDSLAELRKPLSLESQVIHGDLTGNVLFEDDLAPGIIDFTPHWRPVDYASAIVVADALDWYGADESVLRIWDDSPSFDQLLIRAEMFRIAVYDGFPLGDQDIEKRFRAHGRTVELLRKHLMK